MIQAIETSEQRLAFLAELHRLGHFYNPEHPDGHNVTADDLASLNTTRLDDRRVTDAVLSLQQFMALDFSDLVRRRYDREGDLDGAAGLATYDLAMHTHRCGCPDFAHPDEARSGSWPEPCQREGILVSVDSSRAPSGLAEVFNRKGGIFDWVAASYHRIGANIRRAAAGEKPHIRIWWERLGGSTIGMAQFNSRSCSGSVWCKLNPNYYPNDVQVAELLCHELGHNCNFEHTPQSRQGVMSPTIVRRSEFRGWHPGDPSWRDCERMFDPANPIPVLDPDPPPTPATGRLVFERDRAVWRGPEQLVRDGDDFGAFGIFPKSTA